MKFKEFSAQINPLLTFNLNDARKLDPDFHRQQLTYWTGKNYIKPLVGGYYIFGSQEINERDLFTLANKLYEPSYISLESALAYYQIIPESVLGVTSVSARKTTKYESAWGRFSYRSVKPILFFGYKVINPEEKNIYKIAHLEKAVLDYLYLNAKINTIQDFESLRWHKEELQKVRNNELFIKYLKIFDNKSLEKRVNVLMAYIVKNSA